MPPVQPKALTRRRPSTNEVSSHLVHDCSRVACVHARRYPFSRCSVVDSKKIGAESSAKVQAWFDTTSGKALHQYVGEAKTTRKGAVCKCKNIIVSGDKKYTKNAETYDGIPTWTGPALNEADGPASIFYAKPHWVLGIMPVKTDTGHSWSTYGKKPGTGALDECPSGMLGPFEVGCKG